MAYLVVNFKGIELGRQSLRGPIVIGRSAECDVTIRDILLSRRHCRIEACGRDWVVTDLASKNGTFVQTSCAPRRVAQHLLRNGEMLRIGKTAVTFHSGKLNGIETNLREHRRPSDPLNAMADTVTGRVYHRTDRLIHLDREPPVPRPVPRDPVSYDREGVHAMVHELVSSSWDSIYAEASKQPRPERPSPRPIIISPSKATSPKLVLKSASVGLSSPIAAGHAPTTLPGKFHWSGRLLKTAIRFGIVGQWITVLAFRFRR